jgi:AmmeMemoRadiSam system protein A
MSWIWGAFMPHPPVLVPAVGQGREQEAGATIRGVEKLCAELAALPDARPDVLMVLSPHQPYAPGGLFLNAAPRFHGSLSPFGAPQVSLDMAASGDCFNALASYLTERGFQVFAGEGEDITRDHGSIVPLHFIASALGGELPPLVLGSPIGLAPEQALELGKALAAFEPGLRCALLASGDLSHRLKRDGPNGYHPDGQVFDDAVVRAFTEGDPSILTNMPEQTLHNAGECGLRSALVLLGLCNSPLSVFSYEGPFGVGYCNALWTPGKKPRVSVSIRPARSKTAAESHAFPRIARETVRRHLTEGSTAQDIPVSDEADKALLGEQKACFVSIKTKSGDLRGCIGTILPARPRLMQEIMANAVSAAIRDPRFPPMTADELDKVSFSVDVLSTPEPVENIDALDPKVWGVIVSKGHQRGLLLPDLPGVDSVEMQLAIAAQKAGISSMDGVKLERFRVDRYPEE